MSSSWNCASSFSEGRKGVGDRGVVVGGVIEPVRFGFMGRDRKDYWRVLWLAGDHRRVLYGREGMGGSPFLLLFGAFAANSPSFSGLGS